MTATSPRRRAGLLASAAAGLLLLSGCAGNPGTEPGAGGAPPASSAGPSSVAPSPDASAAPTTAAPTSAPTGQPDAAAGSPAALAASDPVTLTIPAIGAGSELLKLGLRENNSLEVPPDGPGAPAGWYSGSPSPGDRGPAVLLGHVNAVGGGPGVFAGLRALHVGAEISVLRADGSTAIFTMDRAAAYSKDAFPTLEVYGNTPGPELRLITCDGYDPSTGLFNDNYVVFAKLKA